MEKVQSFLLELGTGFAYMGREVRIKVGNKEKFIDLLFYNTRVHCYVVVEIKAGEFDSENMGQLGTYVVVVNHQIKTDQDTSELDQEIANYERQLRQCCSNKDVIIRDLDSLDYEDKHYQRRKNDLEDRLYRTYDKMDEMEDLLVDAKAKKRSIQAEKVSGENIYKALIFFDKLYEKMSEIERRQFYEKLLGEVNIYEERQPNGRWIKAIVFKLPIIEHDMELSLDNDDSVETVVLLSRV